MVCSGCLSGRVYLLGGDDMSKEILDLCAKRYIEAQANPSMMEWRSLAYMAGFKADAIQETDPQSVQGEAIRAISEAAWRNYIDMLPQRDKSDVSRTAGVMCGLFGGAA